jgi:hypothetical protein
MYPARGRPGMLRNLSTHVVLACLLTEVHPVFMRLELVAGVDRYVTWRRTGLGHRWRVAGTTATVYSSKGAKKSVMRKTPPKKKAE